MQRKYTWRGFTQNNHLTNCHSRGLLLGIYNASRCKNAVMLNSFQHLHLVQTCGKKEEILNQVQDDNMIQTTRGFTLIELLVVVLIIGILAAVAVPQYQKAVIKSRFVKLQVYVDALHKAAELYYLQTGDYSRDPQVYDIELSAKKIAPSTISLNQDGLFFDDNTECVITGTVVGCKNLDIFFVRMHDRAHVDGWPDGVGVCKGLNKQAEQVCLAISTGEEHPYFSDAKAKAYIIR